MRAPVVVVVLVASGVVNAGVVMEMADRDLTAPGDPGLQRLYFDDGRFRLDSIESGGLATSVIFRNGTMYAVDHGKKQYTVIDRASMDRVATRLAQMRTEMEAQMAAMPPEQRAMIEKMLEGQSPPAGAARKQTRSVKDTGRADNVAGRACRVWEISENGVKQEELCVVAPGSLPGGDALMKTMRELAEMSKGFFEKIGAEEDAMAEAWADLETMKGIPILTREFDDGAAVAESRLTSLREEALGASAFEVPRGFSENKLDMSGGSKDE